MAAPEAAAAPLSAAPAPAPAAAAPAPAAAAPEAAAPPRPDARAWVKAMRGISAHVVAVRTRDAGPAGAEQLALWAAACGIPAVVVDQVVEQVSGIAGLEPERRWQALYGLCQNLYSDGLETVLGGVVGALDDDGKYYVKTPVRPAPRDANGEEEDDEEDDDGGDDDESWDRGEKLRAHGLVGADGRCSDECVETLRFAFAAVKDAFRDKYLLDADSDEESLLSAPDYARGRLGAKPGAARPPDDSEDSDDGDDY
jgi:hypothetical protein